MNWPLLGFIAILAYLIGAIPTAYLLCKPKGVDIFAIGSGNMGTTNVVRALGARYGLYTLLIDIAKGLVTVWLGQQLYTDNPVVGGVVGGIAALFGHSWSVWILLLTGKLKGGKAAATASGTWTALTPWYLTVLVYVVVLGTLYLTRIVSLAVLVGVVINVSVLLILIASGSLPPVMTLYAVVLFVLIFFKHRSNIARLRAGNERRLGKLK